MKKNTPKVTATFKKCPLRLAMAAVLIISPLTVVQAAFLVDNSPIKPGEINKTHLTVIEKFKSSITQRIEAADKYNKLTKNEKEILLKCADDAICQIDRLNLSASTNDAYAKALDKQYKDLVSLEHSDLTLLLEAANKKESDAYANFDLKRKQFQKAYDKSKDLLATFRKSTSVEEFKSNLNSDQLSALEIFGDEIYKNEILLDDLKQYTLSQKHFKRMITARKSHLHSYANQVNVLANRLHGYAEIQLSTANKVAYKEILRFTDESFNKAFGELQGVTNTVSVPFMPNIPGYRFDETKISTPKYNGALPFLTDGSLSSIEKLLSWNGE